jgi:EAL domain-containing protein (putative c-di-GMP-specific phosphodiesterase class I)
LELALEAINTHDAPVNITLTASSFISGDFGWLESLLAQYSAQAKQLTVEIGESVAFSHQASVAAFFKIAHAHGAKVGIGHVGHRIADVAKLSELGVDFIKLDPVFVHDIDSNAGNAALCRAYANIAQSLDIACVASGVATAEELKAAFDAGATTATGSAVSV